MENLSLHSNVNKTATSTFPGMPSKQKVRRRGHYALTDTHSTATITNISGRNRGHAPGCGRATSRCSARTRFRTPTSWEAATHDCPISQPPSRLPSADTSPPPRQTRHPHECKRCGMYPHTARKHCLETDSHRRTKRTAAYERRGENAA